MKYDFYESEDNIVKKSKKVSKEKGKRRNVKRIEYDPSYDEDYYYQ